MSEFVRVAAVDDIPPGTGKEITTGGKILAVFNIDGEFHVIDGICAHAGGPLGKGEVTDNVVTCPWHGWQYDIPSGQHCLTPNIEQTRFEIKIEGDDILVALT